MKLLLDTHIVLWALLGSPQLPQRARDLILDPGNELFNSAVTLWEVALKAPLPKALCRSIGIQIGDDLDVEETQDHALSIRPKAEDVSCRIGALCKEGRQLDMAEDARLDAGIAKLFGV